jgi:hypothetical protein
MNRSFRSPEQVMYVGTCVSKIGREAPVRTEPLPTTPFDALSLRASRGESGSLEALTSKID